MSDSISKKLIIQELEKINDPELPISITDLGLIENVTINSENSLIKIDIMPTFIGCPALEIIEKDIKANLAKLNHSMTIKVHWIHAPNWSPDRITKAGRELLKNHGVSTPCCKGTNSLTQLSASEVPCPNCDSKNTKMESAFGPTRCRMIFYCNSCKNTFEHMKSI